MSVSLKCEVDSNPASNPIWQRGKWPAEKPTKFCVSSICRRGSARIHGKINEISCFLSLSLFNAKTFCSTTILLIARVRCSTCLILWNIDTSLKKKIAVSIPLTRFAMPISRTENYEKFCANRGWCYIATISRFYVPSLTPFISSCVFSMGSSRWYNHITPHGTRLSFILKPAVWMARRLISSR